MPDPSVDHLLILFRVFVSVTFLKNHFDLFRDILQD